MRSVEIYERNGTLAAIASSLSSEGYSFLSGTTRLMAAENPASIGRIVRAAESESQVNVEEPDDNNPLKSLLTLTNIKTWSQFVRNAKCVVAISDDNSWTLIPTENRGAKHGFRHIKTKTVRLPLRATNSKLGDGVLSALKMSC